MQNASSEAEGFGPGGPGDQAGPSVDRRDSGTAASQDGKPRAQPTRPGPAHPDKETDAKPATDGQAPGEERNTGLDREDGSGESPTGGDPRTPNIPGT